MHIFKLRERRSYFNAKLINCLVKTLHNLARVQITLVDHACVALQIQLTRALLPNLILQIALKLNSGDMVIINN